MNRGNRRHGDDIDSNQGNAERGGKEGGKITTGKERGLGTWVLPHTYPTFPAGSGALEPILARDKICPMFIVITFHSHPGEAAVDIYPLLRYNNIAHMED